MFNLALLQKRAHEDVTVQLQDNLLIASRKWTEIRWLGEWDSDIPAERMEVDKEYRMVYDLDTGREVSGRLAHVGLTYMDVVWAKAGYEECTPAYPAVSGGDHEFRMTRSAGGAPSPAISSLNDFPDEDESGYW